MTETQKSQILSLRKSSNGYGTIAQKLKMSLNTINLISSFFLFVLYIPYIH